MNFTFRLILTLFIYFSVPPVSAHHSFATHYDSSNIVQISGVLSGVKMRNPHSFFELAVTDENGKKD